MPPNLEQAFSIFANWQTVVFCLSIYFVTQFGRSIIENAPSTKGFAQGWVWKEVLLPFGPIGTGILLALIAKSFPLPMPIGNSFMAKWMYGGICGLGSGWMYARVRAWWGVAADKGNPLAMKVASKMLSRPVSERPPPKAFSGPPPASPPSVPPAA